MPKGFPKSRLDQQLFTEEFTIILSAYGQGYQTFTNLYTCFLESKS